MENRITISICDEEYTFVAEEAPSYMQKVGSYVNDKMSELLQRRFPIFPPFDLIR